MAQLRKQRGDLAAVVGLVVEEVHHESVPRENLALAIHHAGQTRTAPSATAQVVEINALSGSRAPRDMTSSTAQFGLSRVPMG